MSECPIRRRSIFWFLLVSNVGIFANCDGFRSPGRQIENISHASAPMNKF